MSQCFSASGKRHKTGAQGWIFLLSDKNGCKDGFYVRFQVLKINGSHRSIFIQPYGDPIVQGAGLKV